eukprot:scpid84422/ scgid12726/ 1-phosphatidylinositol 4,5-bisphosphate phosphodiesterase beta-4; Phosphoinositide phospholipase C-beta-4; Phospholipase C-beta-4
MAGAGTHHNRLRPTPPSVPSCLLGGLHFRRWDAEDSDGPFAHHEVKVDRSGLILSIMNPTSEGVPIYLSEVSDVRYGKYARQPKDQKLVQSLSNTAAVSSFEEIAVTIVYGMNLVDTSFINLAAISPDDAKLFVSELRKLLYNVIATNISEAVMLEREHARLCTLRHPEKDAVAAKHIQALFAVKPKEVVQHAMESRGWSSGPKDFIPLASFTLEEFIALHDELVPAPYISDVIERIHRSKTPKPYVTLKEFTRLLNTTHRDPRLNEVLFKLLKEDEVQQILESVEPNADYSRKQQMTPEGLRRYLRSVHNAVTDVTCFTQHQDMEKPLCHYFINSSHNTCLTGHQLTGKATVEIYRQVLLTGCRCIELDCWDGSDGDPIITHGNTLVNNIPFKEVIEAINECAFKVTDYPLLLSFENHCRFRQQRRMVHYLRTILGDKLLLEPLENCPLVPGSPLPSPNQLRGKILCKNKLLVPKPEKGKEEESDMQVRHMSRTITVDDESSVTRRSVYRPQESQEQDLFALSPGRVQSMPANCHLDEARSTSTITPLQTSQRNSTASEFGAPDHVDASISMIAPNGSCELDMPSLVNYLEPVKFKSFEESEEKDRHHQMSSFSETQAIRLVLDFSKEFAKYMQRQNIRIYPRGTRVDSSNYQPQVFWNVGCQMVSLNFQTLDLPMQLNLGKFDYNGRCGYLLKPDVMRRPDRDFDPFAESPIDSVVAASVKITVLAAHMVSSSREQVRVDVDMYGIPADTVRRKFRTKYMQNDTSVYFRSPTVFAFKKVVLADHAMLRFIVVDSQGVQLGMRVLPLPGLEPGYRYIHLHNENNQPLPLACLFVLVEVNEYIPEEMQDFAMGLINPVQYQKENNQRALRNMMDEDPLLGEAVIPTLNARRSTNASLCLSQPKQLEECQARSSTSLDPSVGLLQSGRPRAASSFSTSALHSHKLRPQSMRKSFRPSKSNTRFAKSTGQDIIEGKDGQKMLAKINKEISNVRKKFLKSQASINKLHASELKKNAGQGDDQRIKEKHAHEMAKLVRKCIADEEGVLLKQLPQFFNWVSKTMTSNNNSDVKKLESAHKKNLSALISTNQKENAQKSHQYKEEQKRKVTDKEELQRKIREYSNKIVESAVQVRTEALTQHAREITALEMLQQEAMSDVKAVEEVELERVRKLYVTCQRVAATSEGVQDYMTRALADSPYIFKSASVSR